MMRMTRAQLAVHLICGHNLPMGPRLPVVTCLIAGHSMLVELAKVDFGYDLQRWHDHLKETRQGGYTWNRTITLPKIMKEALASEEWRAAVAQLTRDS